MAAGARVHGPDQDEPGRKGGGGSGPTDPDQALLQRLTQGVEDHGGELTHFVEEQHPAVGQADLPRPHSIRPAADHRDRRGAVMRGSERRPDHQPARRQREPGYRMDPADLQGGRLVEGRQETGKPVGQHRLPRTRWPDQEDMMAAGGRHLQRPPGPSLTPYIRQVRTVDPGWTPVGIGRDRIGAGLARSERPTLTSPQALHQRGQIRCRSDGVLARQAGLDGTHLGDHQDAAPDRFGQHHGARHPPEGAVETQLADERHPLDGSGVQLPGRHQKPDRDGQVQTGPALAHTGGGQIDGHPVAWPRQSTRKDGGPHPVPRLPHRRVGKADHREAGEAHGFVDLDRDMFAVDPDEDGGRNGGDHLASDRRKPIRRSTSSNEGQNR